MIMNSKRPKKDSSYFDFNKLSKPINDIISYEYVGWNGLNVTKFYLPNGKKITNSLIDQHYPDLNKKEKIFVTTQGNIKLKSDDLDTSFKEFDAIDFASSNQKYFFSSLEDTTIFMIGAIDLNFGNGKTTFFNFKKQ